MKNKEIAGAGLDTFEQEPLPKGHPLWKMKNVTIIPYCVAGTRGDYWSIYDEGRVEVLLKNPENPIHGKEPNNVIDKKE